MNRFIVIEGLDGSGKSTQIDLMMQRLDMINQKYKFMHFPRTDAPVYGELIARFLRGEFGDVAMVNPYLVALLYAGDRLDAKETIEGWLSQDYLVIVDRYVYSNMAFQCAKAKNPKEKSILKKWITELEYDYNRIPAPDLSIYLHVPFEFTADKLTAQRHGPDRDYLNGKVDIHESSIELQRSVEAEYLELVEANDDFLMVDCSSADGRMLAPEKINSLMMDILLAKSVITK